MAGLLTLTMLTVQLLGGLFVMLPNTDRNDLASADRQAEDRAFPSLGGGRSPSSFASLLLCPLTRLGSGPKSRLRPTFAG